jgi:hypothetical protein
LLANAAAAATRATTSCISSCACSARSSRVARAHLRPDAARVCPEQDKNKSHFSKESREPKNKFQEKKLTEVAGRINSSNTRCTHSNRAPGCCAS